MTYTYISHGYFNTGGYFLETALCEQLGNEYREVRFKEVYRGPLAWFQLFLKTFFAARGDGFITVARLVWPVYFRNIFNKKKIVLVLHNYDPTDGKPKLYYALLSRFLKLAAKKQQRISVVVVSEFWRDFLKNEFQLKSNIFLFPNLFEAEKYRFFADIASKKPKLIHLGQYSDKIDKKEYHKLIYELKKYGYECYFSSPHDVGKTDFPVTVFHTTEAYLKQMAIANFTVIVNRLKEGWNRVAHESFLCGTPVIAYGGGGLSELVAEAGGINLQNPDDAIQVILAGEVQSTGNNLIDKYRLSTAGQWFQPIGEWLSA